MLHDDPPPSVSRVSLRQLEVFRAIMMTGSVSDAARLLSVSQPAVTRILQLTEERVGFALFERLRRRLSPTPEARQIFEEAEQAFAGLKRVDDLIQGLNEGRNGKLNIACSPSFAVHLIPETIARFNRRYPRQALHFQPLTHDNLLPRVLFGKNYLGVSMFDVPHPNLHSEPLLEVPLMCVSPPGWLPAGTSIGLRELAGLPWIDYDPATPLGRIVGQAFGKVPRPAPVVEVRSAISACALVREGVGVSLVDPFCIDDALRARLDARALDAAPRFKAHILHARAEPLSHVARNFIEVLRSALCAAQHQGRFGTLAPQRPACPAGGRQLV